MTARALILASALLAASVNAAYSQSRDNISAPVLRAQVTVSDDVVRIGDLIDNAGSSGRIAVYRAPDLGTTGSLPVAQVLNALRAHQVIGVDTRDLQQVSVTRLARTLEGKEIETQVARALERRNGLGEAANLALTFDRDPGDVRLDASHGGTMQPVAVRYEARTGRFDVAFEVSSDNGAAPAKLRFTGTAIETVQAAVLARGVERGEVVKSSDVVSERRPKAEVGLDAVDRDHAVGMQARRQIRVGTALKSADLARPDLVQRDQPVTLIYEAEGLYLTVRGKALDGGTEGDVVNVMNLQSKRTVAGIVTGRGQVSISVATPRPAPVAPAPSADDKTSSLGAEEPVVPLALAHVSSIVAPKAE